MGRKALKADGQFMNDVLLQLEIIKIFCVVAKRHISATVSLQQYTWLN